MFVHLQEIPGIPTALLVPDFLSTPAALADNVHVSLRPRSRHTLH